MTQLRNIPSQTPAPHKGAASRAHKSENKLQAAAAQQSAEESEDLNNEFAALLALETDPALLEEQVDPNGQLASNAAVPANVTAEDLNWSFEKEMGLKPSGEPTPKVINPELVKEVDGAIQPESVQAGELQLKDLLMGDTVSTGKAAPMRSPAIDLSDSEVDPQLLKFEDFLAHKKAVTGKVGANDPYGMMKAKTTGLNNVQSEAMPESKLQWSVENAGSPSPVQTASANPQDIWTVEAPIVPMTGAAQKADLASNKVFNMQSLDSAKSPVTSDTILSDISDYIVQARMSKEPTVQMRVQHQELGMMDITVTRGIADSVSISIGAHDASGKLFLGQNREGLMSHLGQAGIHVSDFRLESGNSRDMGQNQHAPGQHQSNNRQFGSEQNQRRDDQERRQELWNLLREKEVA